MNVTTRSEALKIEYSDPYPRTLPDGRKIALLTEEVFIASSGDYTRKEAEKKLNKIREEHPSKNGWECFGHEGIFEEIDRRTKRKLFFAWRHHAVYE